MSFLIIAVTANYLFSPSPDHRPAYFCVWFCFCFCFCSLGCGKNLQEHKRGARGEVTYVNELYFKRLPYFI